MRKKRKKDQERSSNRRSQIGTGDDLKDRTYNFPQEFDRSQNKLNIT